jgi:hypothetical protein
VSPVAGKLIALTGKGGGEIGPAQTIVLKENLKDKVRMKISRLPRLLQFSNWELTGSTNPSRKH